MGLFKKKKKDEAAEEVVEATEEATTEADETAEENQETAQEESDAPEFSRSEGPWDEEEKDTSEGYIDFGSMRIKMLEGLNMRLDIEQKSQRLVAVTLTKGNNTLQVQAFAAPKSKGIWDDIRTEIAESIHQQGGKVDIKDGALGREMISRLPATTSDGRQGFRVARFVGVDGPRWFLRGVFSGEAALNADEAAEMEEVFRSIVVVRGEDPRPPRDLLDMTVPVSIQQAQERQAEEAKKAAEEKQKLEMPRRGPEIAEIR